jgi:hypothetical protein
MTSDELHESEPPDEGPYACPCCYHLTLPGVAQYDICTECGWEDDGQDSAHADEVWGGPNGSLSLTAAREQYGELVANPELYAARKAEYEARVRKVAARAARAERIRARWTWRRPRARS